MSKLQYSSYDDMLKALRCEVIEPFKKAMADKGLRFDKDYRNSDGENVYFVTESGVTIRVAFDGRATGDSRWDHTYQHRTFFWKVEPRYGRPSNRPRKVKMDKDGVPDFTDLLASVDQNLMNLEAEAKNMDFVRRRNEKLTMLLTDLGYILDNTLIVLHDWSRIQAGEQFFTAPKGGATTIIFFDGTFRHDAYVYYDQDTNRIKVLKDTLTTPSQQAPDLSSYMATIKEDDL